MKIRETPSSATQLNILFIGRLNSFMKSLVLKFYKEKHKVFLLTDKKSILPKPKEVFEQYDFDYTANGIKNILDSVKPDRVIFFGAFDTGLSFSDSTIREDSLSFISGLMNILMCCGMVGIKNFFFLSSDGVFESSYPEAITEETETSPRSFRNLILAQAEDLVERYGVTTSINTIVVRIANLYGIPMGREDATDFCSKMCLSALIQKSIGFNDNNQYTAINIQDAVEGLYRIVISETWKHNIYHLASDEIVTEKTIADIIAAQGIADLSVTDKTVAPNISRCLDATRAIDEFGISIRNEFAPSVLAVYKYISSHLSTYLTKEEKSKMSFLNRFSAKTQRLIKLTGSILENLLVFGVIFLVDRMTVDSAYFEKLDFYLLYVLLFALTYGRQQAIFAAFLSVMGFILTQATQRGSFAVLIDFNTYVWIAQLFIVGMTVGHLKEKIKLVTDDMDEKIDYLSLQLNEIEEIDDSNKRIKLILENRLVNYSESLGMLYDIVSKVDCLDSGQVLFRAAEIVAQTMQTDDVSIYRVSNKYARLFAATSKQARSLGKTIQYEKFGLMSKALVDKTVFINKELDFTLPSIARAVYSENGDIELIIMVWSLKIERLTLYQANLITVLGYVISSAVHRSNLYLDALSDKRFIEGTQILDHEAFAEILAIHSEAVSRGVAECSLLIIEVEKDSDLGELSKVLRKAIRETDYLGLDEDDNACLLLTNTGADETDVVVKRLESLGIEVAEVRAEI